MKQFFKIQAVGITALLFLLILLIRLVCTIHIAHEYKSQFLHDDGYEYILLAESFLKNGSFITQQNWYFEAPRNGPAPEMFRSLLLPLTGSAGIAVFRDPYTGTAVVQALFATILSLLIFLTAKELGGWSAGFCALGIFSIHPVFLTFSFRFSSEILFTLFLTLYIFCFIRFRGIPRAVLLGLAGGLAAVTRPTALLLLPAYAVFLLCRQFLPFMRMEDQERIQWKKEWMQYMIYACVFAVCLVPDSMRTMKYFHEIRPGYYLGGYNAFIGNCRENMKAYQAKTADEFLKYQYEAWMRVRQIMADFPEHTPPPEQQKRLVNAVCKDIASAGPWKYGKLLTHKAWHFIRPWPLYGAHPANIFWAVSLFECVLFALGIAGAVRFRRRKDLLLFLLMIFSIGWVAHTVFHIQMRHRIPFLDMPMILLAGVIAAELIRRCIARFKKAPELK